MTNIDGVMADTRLCTFCGKTQKDVKALIAGPSVHICNECIALCNDILEDKFPVPKEANDVALYAKGYVEGYLAYYTQLGAALNLAGSAQENLEKDPIYVSLLSAVPKEFLREPAEQNS